LVSCKNPEELKTVEGNIARHFFSAIRLILPSEIGFERREREDPDLYNVLLNAGHGLLRARIINRLGLHGVNMGYGFLHYQKDKNKPFLAWDLAELWIPQVDKICLYAVEKRIITEKSLKKAENGPNPFWLSQHGWEKIYPLLDRIPMTSIDMKIEEFKNSVMSGSRFGWKTKF
jgi:CRISPR-associated endonuclease Cas1